jgi:hypothetical protein
LRFLYDKRSVVSGTEQCTQTKNNYYESDRHNTSLNKPQQHSSAGIKYSEFLAKLCALGNKWNFLIAGSIPGPAVSPTRHLLADAISSGKAERKDDQIGNYVWQRRTFYDPIATGLRHKRAAQALQSLRPSHADVRPNSPMVRVVRRQDIEASATTEKYKNHSANRHRNRKFRIVTHNESVPLVMLARRRVR